MSASLAPECNEVKERYDNCFLKWYSEKFLRGTATTDECAPLFDKYKACLSKALEARGIDTMLRDAREDNRENDAEHMRPVRETTSPLNTSTDGFRNGRCTNPLISNYMKGVLYSNQNATPTQQPEVLTSNA